MFIFQYSFKNQTLIVMYFNMQQSLISKWARTFALLAVSLSHPWNLINVNLPLHHDAELYNGN